jgi:hypothetical protein
MASVGLNGILANPVSAESSLPNPAKYKNKIYAPMIFYSPYGKASVFSVVSTLRETRVTKKIFLQNISFPLQKLGLLH